MCVVVVVLKKKRYLAGYLLRTGTPALTCSRWRRNPAVTEPPTKVRIPMCRLEERILEKLLAIFYPPCIWVLKKMRKVFFFTATGKEGQVDGSVGKEVPVMEWKGVRLRSSDVKMEEYTARTEIQLHLQNKSTRLKRLMFLLQMRTHNLHPQMWLYHFFTVYLIYSSLIYSNFYQMYSNYTFFFKEQRWWFQFTAFYILLWQSFQLYTLIMNHMQYQSQSECLWLYTVTSHSCERVQLETNSAYEIYYSQLDLF